MKNSIFSPPFFVPIILSELLEIFKNNVSSAGACVSANSNPDGKGFCNFPAACGVTGNYNKIYTNVAEKQLKSTGKS